MPSHREEAAVRGLVLEGPGRIVVRHDLPEPALRDDRDAIVEVALAGLCGSDLHPYLGREPVRAGTIPGHELVGVVRAVGSAVAGLAVGDRVLAPFSTSCGACAPCRRALTARCREGELLGWRPVEDPPPGAARGLDGAQAERVRIPLAATTLLRVPPSVDDATALLLGDNFTTGWFAAEQAGAAAGATIAVVGCGAVGLSALAAAAHLGAGALLAIDPVAERRRAAAELGALAAAPDGAAAALATLAGEGVDAVVEAVGDPAAQRLAFTLVRPGGTIAAVGVHTAPFAFLPADAYDRNLTYRAGRAPVRALLDRLLPAVAAGRIRVPADQIVSERATPLADGPAAYRRFAAREAGVRKILFRT
jgi:threonine dehydrogenase-like Zn-dependent dehydrogenase